MEHNEYIRLLIQITILKAVQMEYSGKTIDNIITQLEARKEEALHEIEKYQTI